MSCATSDAITSSAAMMPADPPLHLVPGKSRCRIAIQIGLPSIQLFYLPIRYGNIRGRGGEIVPEILHQLELLGWAKIEYGSRALVHGNRSVSYGSILSRAMLGEPRDGLGLPPD